MDEGRAHVVEELHVRLLHLPAHLLEAPAHEVDVQLDADHHHGTVDANRLDLHARERRQQDLALMRVSASVWVSIV